MQPRSAIQSLSFDQLHMMDELKFSKMITKNNVDHLVEGIPLLHHTVRSLGPVHLQILLNNKVNINAKVNSKDGFTWKNRSQLVKIYDGYSHHATALQWITGCLFKEDYLLDHPRNYFTSDDKSVTPLQSSSSYLGSAKEKMIQIAKTLLENKATLDFYSAAALGNLDFVNNYLKTHKETVNVPGPDGDTALVWAARRDQLDMVHLLVKHGAKVDTHNTFRRTSHIVDQVVECSEAMLCLPFLIDHLDTSSSSLFSSCPSSLNKLDCLLGKIKSEHITRDTFILWYAVFKFNVVVKLFHKHNISLSMLDNQEIENERHGLLEYGLAADAETVRCLIDLGCNIHAPIFRWKLPDTGHSELQKFLPISYMLTFIDKYYKHDKLEIIAILIINGASFNNLDGLVRVNLVNFLLYLDNELKIPQNRIKFAKICPFEKHIVFHRIDEALKYLQGRNEIPNLLVDKLNAQLRIASLREHLRDHTVTGVSIFQSNEHKADSIEKNRTKASMQCR